jgi:hypothetical protein
MREEKDDVHEKRGWKEHKQPWPQKIYNKIIGETGSNGAWFVGEGDRCYRTG